MEERHRKRILLAMDARTNKRTGEINFSCAFCKIELKTPDCKGCPVYVQSFDPD